MELLAYIASLSAPPILNGWGSWSAYDVTQQSALMEIVNLSNAWLYEESIERRLERHNNVTKILIDQVVQTETGKIAPQDISCEDSFYDTHCI